MQNAPNQETNFFSQKSFPFGKKKQTQHLCIYQTTCKAQEKNSKATAKQASHLEAASSKCCPHHPWGKMAPKANEGESTRPSASHRPWPNPPQAPGAFWAAPGAVAGAAPPHPAEPQGSHTALGTQNQEGEHDLPSVQDFHPAPACPGLLTACSRQPASRARSKVVVAALGPPPPHGRCSALTRSGWTRSLPLLADRLAREGEYRFPPQHWSAAPRGPGRPSLFFISDSFVQHRNVNSIPSAASICRAEARFADYILPPTPRVSALPSARGAQLSLRWPTQPVHGAAWHTAGTALQN